MISLLCLTETIAGDIIMIIITSVWTMAHRKSKQKEAIIKVLRRTSSHPTAEWIYEQARKEMPGIGLATVYRNLRSLKEAGEISEMHIFSDAARFDVTLTCIITSVVTDVAKSWTLMNPSMRQLRLR